MAFFGIAEKIASRRQSGTSAERRYVINGYYDDKQARDAVLNYAPQNVTVTEPFGTLQLIRLDEDVEVDEIHDGLWYAVVNYKSPPDATRPSGSFQVSFDISGMQTKITQSLQTITSYLSPSATTAGITKPNFMGAINVGQDGTIDGTDINVPLLTYAVVNTYTNTQMSASFIQTIVTCVGSPNSTTYRGFNAGQLLLVSASGLQRGDTNWDVSYKFAVGKPAVNATVGDITGINCDGWDYLWVYYEERHDTTTNRCNKVPVAAYVERILTRAEYANLNIGSM